LIRAGAWVVVNLCAFSLASGKGSTMSDLDKLRKENKKLRELLKNAVELLNQSKKLLKNPEKFSAGKKKKTKK
jgi:hypothetical protein